MKIAAFVCYNIFNLIYSYTVEASNDMAFTNWKSLKKIDSHIHILPNEVLAANPNSNDVWHYADLKKYLAIAKDFCVEKAVVMPLNDPWLMSMDFTVNAAHRNLWNIKKEYPDKFYAFADVDIRNTSGNTVSEIMRAVDEYGLDGIKIHASNTGIAIDDEYNAPIYAFAQRRNIPIAIHSYPDSENDVCAAKRIVSVSERYPELKLIVSHMGAFQWKELLPTQCYVDMSAILPDYVRAYGIAKTNDILRAFGADRLLFATDYPDNRHLQPEEIYDCYMDILNQMDFTEEEAVKIAYANAKNLLG